MPPNHATEQKPPDKKPTHPEITVTSNGIDHPVEYNPHQAMQALLEHALNTFDVRENRHTMALFTTDDVELPVEGSVEDAGVKPGDVLVLRPSRVRGGSC